MPQYVSGVTGKRTELAEAGYRRCRAAKPCAAIPAQLRSVSAHEEGG